MARYWIEFPVPYCRTSFFIHSMYKEISSAHPKLQSFPPWQPQACSLCPWVCSCFTHMWNLKGTYQWNRNRLIDIENRLVVAKEGRIGSFGLADKIYLYIEWIKNEVLQYGTGKFIQNLGINHNGKEYACRAESICCTAEKNYTSIHFFNF